MLAKVRFDVGATADIMSPGEHSASLRHVLGDMERERVRGRKHMRFQMSAVPSGGAVTIGTGTQPVGPDAGYAWSISRLTASGLTASATTPDELNIYFNNATGVAEWQLTGNNWAYTFGKCELTMYGGDILIAASTGSFAATGTIIVRGEARQVPQEMLGEFL